jgi:putative tricarboxylic transport membrane protein
VAVVAVLAVLAGCGGAGAPPPPDKLRIIVSTPPGGGFDMTARVVAVALERSDLVDVVEVVNLPGEKGMAALSRVIYEEGDATLMLQMGLGLVANTYVTDFPGSLDDLTPLARLIEEPEAVIVAASSPYRTLDELVEDVRARPQELTVGGGSQPGGPDHLATMFFAEGIGVEPASIHYQPHDGGGEMLASLVSGEVDFALAGTAQNLHAIRAGELRVLAVSGSSGVPGIEAPTLAEAGVDLEFMNWRGLLAPPGLTEAEQNTLVALLSSLRETQEWKAALNEYGWTESFLGGEEFASFLRDEGARVQEALRAWGLGDLP